jgi:hypothetical protein
MTQSSILSYPKPLFCNIVVKKTKEVLMNYGREGGDYNLAMILQVMDHCSCRLTSKYVLKHFLDEQGKPLKAEDEFESILQEERMLFNDDRSSIFFVDQDFKDNKEEELLARTQT